MAAPDSPRSPMRARLDLPAAAILTGVCMTLGLGQVAIKVANAGITPIMQAGLRSIGSAILLWLFCRWRGIRLISQDGTLWPGILAGLFFAAEFGFLYPGIERTTAGRAVTFLYTAPFVVAIGAHFLIPGDRLTPTKIAGLITAFAGVAVVLGGGILEAGTATLLGDLLCLAGALAWGALTLVCRASALARVPAEKQVLIQLIVSGLVLPPVALMLGEVGLRNPTPLHWAAFAFTVVFVSFIAFTAQFWVLSRYPPSRVMTFLFLVPPFGVMWGGLLLGEPVTLSLLVGLALVGAGIWLVNLGGRAGAR